MKKQKYEAPALTAVEFKVESGYATSIASLGTMEVGFTEVGNTTDMFMGEAMQDLTNGGTTTSYFGYSGGTTEEGTGGFGSTQFGSYF